MSQINQSEFGVGNGKSVAGVINMALDLNGNPQPISAQQGLPIYDAYLNPVVTSWNSATANGTAVVMNTAGMDTVALTISAPAGITGGTITFNVFDGAAYIPIKCARLSSYNTDSTYTIMPGVVNAWTVPAAGYPIFQFVLTGSITGTGTVTITSIVSSAPDTSICTVGVDPLSLLPTHEANTLTNNLLQVRAFCTASTAAIAVKSSAGKIHRIDCVNGAAALRYLKLYNLASGSVVPGSTVPFKTYALAIGQNQIDLSNLGHFFSTAISYNITTNLIDSDNTAPAANDVLTQIDYI